MTAGVQRHGLNELFGHLRGMVHRLRELYLCMCIYQRTGKVVTIWDILESAGPEQDIDGMELRDGCCPGFSWDRVSFFPGRWYGTIFWI